jgi:hypothetical protein
MAAKWMKLLGRSLSGWQTTCGYIQTDGCGPHSAAGQLAGEGATPKQDSEYVRPAAVKEQFSSMIQFIMNLPGSQYGREWSRVYLATLRATVHPCPILQLKVVLLMGVGMLGSRCMIMACV